MLDWMDYYAVEPFGEQRADQRAAVNSLFVLNTSHGKYCDFELLHPYFPDPGELYREQKALQERHEDPALREKLRQARIAHMAATKPNG